VVVTSGSWLIDKSALVRLGDCDDQDQWAERIERGLVHVSTITLLEAGFSARSAHDMVDVLDRPPVSIMPVEYLTPAVENRAVEVLRSLAERGQHRAPSIPDLLIAAAAERGRLTVLHVDKDFELIAEVTGQAVQRLQ
jgi:predicted nucleic acid-binding protein